MIDATPIGTVEADDEPNPAERRDRESTIVVDADFEAGLYRIEENDHLVVVFRLHRASEPTLRGPRRYGSERGVFSSRSPNRPGKVGVTTVELLERDGRRLRVRGLDAVDGTPVLDVKPFVPGLDSPPAVDPEPATANPRAHVDAAVRRRDLDSLFADAAALHGRYCPLLAAGVVAATYAARDLGGRTTAGLLAAVETDGCLLDASQSVLGATDGNGRLHWRTTDEPALTAIAPDGDAMRIELEPAAIRSVLDVDELSYHVDSSRDDGHRLSTALTLLRRPLSDIASIESDAAPPEWLPER